MRHLNACWLYWQECPPFLKVKACSLWTGSHWCDVWLVSDALPLGVWQGGVAIVYVVGDERVLLLLKEECRCAVAALGELFGQLPKLLRVGQRLKQGVFPLQHRVPLIQLFDVFFQHLHLLSDSIHQVTLHQVLKDKERGNLNWLITKSTTHYIGFIVWKTKKMQVWSL